MHAPRNTCVYASICMHSCTQCIIACVHVPRSSPHAYTPIHAPPYAYVYMHICKLPAIRHTCVHGHPVCLCMHARCPMCMLSMHAPRHEHACYLPHMHTGTHSPMHVHAPPTCTCSRLCAAELAARTHPTHCQPQPPVDMSIMPSHMLTRKSRYIQYALCA